LLLAIRYGDGSYGARHEYAIRDEFASLALLPLAGRVVHSGSFSSPKCLPETTASWAELLEGAELIAYAPSAAAYVLNKPRHQALEEWDPALANAGSIYEIVRGLNKGKLSNVPDYMGPDDIGLLLECHAWSHRVWHDHILSFLKEHAAESHVPLLLARLQHDPHIGQVFVAKGWFEQAEPFLRQHLIDGRHAHLEILREFAERRDPALGGALASQIVTNGNDLTPLAPLLRDFPGLEWKAAVKQGWRLRNSGLVRGNSVRPLAIWAAESGELSALRWLAENAARGDAECATALARVLGDLVPDGADLIDWLRENIDAVTYESGYRLP